MSLEGDFLRMGMISDLDGGMRHDGALYARNLYSPPNNVWYVDDAQTAGIGNGKSWSRAFKTVTLAQVPAAIKIP